MKAYLFIETGEVGKAKHGEFYLSDKEIFRYEMEIPEGAKDVYVGAWMDGRRPQLIWEGPLPRPKKKVKKWKWYIVEENDVSSEYYTDDEAHFKFEGYELFRLDPTEREVEE